MNISRFTIAMATLGLAGGMAAGTVPAAAATHPGATPAAEICTWRVNANDTGIYKTPGVDKLATVNSGVLFVNTSVQTGSHDGVTYEHGTHNTTGWVRTSRLTSDGCKTTK